MLDLDPTNSDDTKRGPISQALHRTLSRMHLEITQ